MGLGFGAKANPEKVEGREPDVPAAAEVPNPSSVVCLE